MFANVAETWATTYLSRLESSRSGECKINDEKSNVFYFAKEVLQLLKESKQNGDRVVEKFLRKESKSPIAKIITQDQ